MKKVSIIIPLYNLEKLIGKCIASALAQDLSPEEYEILVIDDGSTDGSLAAAEKAAQGHPNVHVYTKPNEGLSRTRNYGTDRAAGRYVMYLDADDYLEPNVLGHLVETMECGGLDMLCFEIAGIDENGNDVPLWSDGISAGNGSDVQRGVDFLQRDRFLPMVYAYLYSQEMPTPTRCGWLRSGTRTKSSHPARCITHGGSNTSPSGFTTTCNAAIRSWAITSRKVA